MSPQSYTLIDGVTRTLDWQMRLDPTSLNYKITEHFGPIRPARNRIWTKNIWLDQGTYDCPICHQSGACTGYSSAQAIATTPKVMTAVSDQVAHAIYHGAKERDEWEGTDYEGSSVLGAMQYLKDTGVLANYFWATTLEEIITGVSYYGPMVCGINWYNEMFKPDANGYLNLGGGAAGGHAIEIGGINVARQAFWLPNSWSKTWGINGGAWIKWSNMQFLLDAGGEFALPRKRISGPYVLTA